VVRVSVLTNTQNIAMLAGKRAMEPMAQKVGIRVDYMDVRSPELLDAALAVAKAQSDGIVLTDEQVITTGNAPRHVADFALRNRLPSVGPVHYAEAGGLIGYGVDWTDVVRRSMFIVDKILKGSKPATLPIEQARKFLVSINLNTAKALDLAIPPSLLLRADQVIE
jgi:ABC-type uncharacterized transport system substrate-binding protein